MRVEHCFVRGGSNGVGGGQFNTVSDTTITGATRGINIGGASTLRNVDVTECDIGVKSVASVVLLASRVGANSIAIDGAYTNGGGNVLQ